MFQNNRAVLGVLLCFRRRTRCVSEQQSGSSANNTSSLLRATQQENTKTENTEQHETFLFKDQNKSNRWYNRLMLLLFLRQQCFSRIRTKLAKKRASYSLTRRTPRTPRIPRRNESQTVCFRAASFLKRRTQPMFLETQNTTNVS